MNHYRIIYLVHDDVLLVVVVTLGHRREVYGSYGTGRAGGLKSALSVTSGTSAGHGASSVHSTNPMSVATRRDTPRRAEATADRSAQRTSPKGLAQRAQRAATPGARVPESERRNGRSTVSHEACLHRQASRGWLRQTE